MMGRSVDASREFVNRRKALYALRSTLYAKARAHHGDTEEDHSPRRHEGTKIGKPLHAIRSTQMTTALGLTLVLRGLRRAYSVERIAQLFLRKRSCQQFPDFRHRHADADVDLAEERVDGADFVEAHLVNQLLEDQRIVTEQVDTPLPVVEAD